VGSLARIVTLVLNVEVDIRDDLVSACESEWARLARPGSWWAAADRVELASVARAALHCTLCRDRKEAVTPFAVNGVHDGPDRLGPDLVDAAHRIRTDAARLTRDWVEDLSDRFSATSYVELVGVVVTEVFVDTLALALGGPLPEFPPVEDGEPLREPPPYTTLHSAWVPTVPPERATGAVADVYGLSAYSVVSNVIRALSLVPQELSAQGVRGSATYRSEHLVLSKPQVELVATATSSANDCFY
jgi:hypothetical protein